MTSSEATPGYFSLVLHTHMPYVRKNGTWPVGEDWLFQAMSNTYLPVIETLGRLGGEGLKECAAFTLTPVLCEQVADPYIQDKFVEYLKTMADHASDDIRDFEYFNDAARKALAESYRDDFDRKLAAFSAIDGDIIGAFSALERLGVIETIASSATHAFLPGQDDARTVANQVSIGVEAHHRHLGIQPAGFWIPECAYATGLETLLEKEGIRYIIVDPSAFGDDPSGCARIIGVSSVSALAMNEKARSLAWDEASGYPTDDLYIDSTKYYHGSGLLYWKVTGRQVPIEEKGVYIPDEASRRALEHSRDFLDEVSEEISASSCEGGANPLVLAAYDTELFGHAWHEGIQWLETTLRSLAASSRIKVCTPSGYLAANPPSKSLDLLETSWGTDRDHSTWLNERTEWMWRRLRETQEKYFELAAKFGASPDVDNRRALDQIGREVLLLESSDWPYMVAKDRAKKYATERFNTHLERFSVIADALVHGELDRIRTLLSEVEEADNIFAQVDLGVISGH